MYLHGSRNNISVYTYRQLDDNCDKFRQPIIMVSTPLYVSLSPEILLYVTILDYHEVYCDLIAILDEHRVSPWCNALRGFLNNAHTVLTLTGGHVINACGLTIRHRPEVKCLTDAGNIPFQSRQ